MGKAVSYFSPGKGWEDTGNFGVLLGGWNEDGENMVVVGNVGFGADFVGLSVVW